MLKVVDGLGSRPLKGGVTITFQGLLDLIRCFLIAGTHFFLFFFPCHLVSSLFFFRAPSYIVATRIRGHIASSSPPPAHYGTRLAFFSREGFSSGKVLLVGLDYSQPTNDTSNNNSSSRHGLFAANNDTQQQQQQLSPHQKN